MTFRWRQNYDDIKTICGWQGSRWRERWISRAQRILRAVKLCHHSSKCSSSLILWSKPIGCTTLRANPSRNYRVCVIMMSQCRLLKGDKGTPVPDAHSGGADFLIRIWLFVVAPPRLLCPWDSSGKNTGMSCHFLLQGPFPTQGLNPRLLCLLHCRQILSQLLTIMKTPLKSLVFNYKLKSLSPITRNSQNFLYNLVLFCVRRYGWKEVIHLEE